jgi:hypothetical protein
MAEKRIDDAFIKYFSGDTLKNALDFAKFISSNEMIYDGEYKIHYKGKLACYIDTPNDKSNMWRIWTVGDYSNEYEDFQINEPTKEIAWANVVYCGNCDDCDRDPGKTEMIFGREFTNVCNGTESLAMRFSNPKAEVLACVKKLIDMRKYFIDSCTT